VKRPRRDDDLIGLDAPLVIELENEATAVVCRERSHAAAEPDRQFERTRVLLEVVDDLVAAG
jgi:hypothetical protein